MATKLSRIRSPNSVQQALNEFGRLGRAAFLASYGFGKSRDYLVRNPLTGEMCDSKAIVGVAFGFEHPGEGPLKPDEFSGGEATIVSLLQKLGFGVVKIGEDWSKAEVDATIRSYFEMLALEARQTKYVKTSFNEELRQSLNARSKASVELKFQNVSAVLNGLGLPYIPGYKPRGNSQLLLRQAVQDYVLKHTDTMQRVVDAMEEDKTPGESLFKAVVVEPPPLVDIVKREEALERARLPRKMDYAGRDEANRRLGRSGEHWVLEFEQHRLTEAGRPDLYQKLSWVSDTLGDGAGYDILSFESSNDAQRFIEVKTTNGPHGTAFIISRNELDFSKEVGDAFHLYRLFRFREAPALYMLRGDVAKHVHLEALDYRASFRRLVV
jgi:Domain of unknown function (DUF3883)